MHLDLKPKLTAGCGGRGRGYLDVHGLPAAEREVGPGRGVREGRPPGRQDGLHGWARDRAVAVAPHDGCSATWGGLDTPGVAAVVGDPADLERGHPRGRPQDVQGLAETETREWHSRHLQQDVSDPEPAGLPGRLEREDLLDPDQVGPRSRGIWASVNGKSQTQGVSLYFHFKCVVEIRKFRYEQSIWFLTFNRLELEVLNLNPNLLAVI